MEKEQAFSFFYSVADGSRDLLLGLAHSDGDLDESVGDGLVAAEVHELWSHWDAELLSHTLDFLSVWLSGESRGKSVETLLGVHETLKLGSWVTLVHVLFELLLLLSSLGISGSDGLVHLSLHLGGSLLGLLDRELLVVTELDE